jgi:uncharacterized membrane protein YuzA (DUF378 family)
MGDLSMDRETLTQLLGYAPPSYQQEFRLKAIVDFWTLVIVLLGALYLGVVALGYDVADLLAPDHRRWVYGLIGLSAIWQLSRQRIF